MSYSSDTDSSNWEERLENAYWNEELYESSIKPETVQRLLKAREKMGNIHRFGLEREELFMNPRDVSLGLIAATTKTAHTMLPSDITGTEREMLMYPKMDEQALYSLYHQMGLGRDKCPIESGWLTEESGAGEDSTTRTKTNTDRTEILDKAAKDLAKYLEDTFDNDPTTAQSLRTSIQSAYPDHKTWKYINPIPSATVGTENSNTDYGSKRETGMSDSSSI